MSSDIPVVQSVIASQAEGVPKSPPISNLLKACAYAPHCPNAVSVHSVHNRCKVCLGKDHDPAACLSCQSLKRTQLFAVKAYFKKWRETGRPGPVAKAYKTTAPIAVTASTGQLPIQVPGTQPPPQPQPKFPLRKGRVLLQTPAKETNSPPTVTSEEDEQQSETEPTPT